MLPPAGIRANDNRNAIGANGGTLTIEGGTFTGGVAAASPSGHGLIKWNAAVVLKGGTFASGGGAKSFSCNSPISGMLAEGYKAQWVDTGADLTAAELGAGSYTRSFKIVPLSLADAITAANNAKYGISVSDQPASSVASGTKFVTTAEMKALTDAIAAAQAVADNTSASAGEITAAVNALNSAVLTFKASIKTGTYVSGGGSTGGSSSGGSSVTYRESLPKNYHGATKIMHNIVVPDYVVEGSWQQTADGRWRLSRADGQNYTDAWVPAYNSYANLSAGQLAFDWFVFDKDGYMMTGWYTDEKGERFYLNTASDNTQGAMKTGWNLIDGKYYYFNEEPDGTRGKLYQNTKTPDGYYVDKDGVWDGKER